MMGRWDDGTMEELLGSPYQQRRETECVKIEKDTQQKLVLVDHDEQEENCASTNT
jgi:hypothetical protein